jgi:5-(carboxyamino)imidazole ribonucleotide synthase
VNIGILGNGQLARMLALAGRPLGVGCVFYADEVSPCTRNLGETVCGHFDDGESLDTLAKGTQRITVEKEDLPVASLEALQARELLAPGLQAVAASQDRLDEKTLLRRLDIATAPFWVVDSLEDLRTAMAEAGNAAILKTRRSGYDGRGQWRLDAGSDLDAVWRELAGRPALLEGMVPFDCELSIIGVRGDDGECRFWPLSENTHRDGILHISFSRPGHPLQGRAEDILRRLMEALDYVGVLALELFLVGDELLANEFAPRVHNSGHWTIEGAVTSQFENHVRAVAGLPLGDTAPRGYSAMINLLGEIPPVEALLAVPGVHLHCYDKAPKPGRKLGHVTLCADDPAALQQQLQPLYAVLGLEEGGDRS